MTNPVRPQLTPEQRDRRWRLAQCFTESPYAEATEANALSLASAMWPDVATAEDLRDWLGMEQKEYIDTFRPQHFTVFWAPIALFSKKLLASLSSELRGGNQQKK